MKRSGSILTTSKPARGCSSYRQTNSFTAVTKEDINQVQQYETLTTKNTAETT